MDPTALVNMLRLIPFLLLPCLASCEEKKVEAAMPLARIKLSDHPRAAGAAARVRPALERDLAAKGLQLGDPIFIRAFKEEKLLEVHVRQRSGVNYELFRTYKIAASSGGPGPKLAEGDGQVPEGFYFVPPAAMNPESQYHLSFNIGYPNAYDSFHRRTGSAIMVHGNQVSIGCLAMTDAKIEEIYTLADAALRNGQPYFRIHLFPFRMTDERLQQESSSPHHEFWKNLKQGYDLFEKNRQPPEATVSKAIYVFK